MFGSSNKSSRDLRQFADSNSQENMAHDNDSEGMHLLFLLPVAPSIELLLETMSLSV